MKKVARVASILAIPAAAGPDFPPDLPQNEGLHESDWLQIAHGNISTLLTALDATSGATGLYPPTLAGMSDTMALKDVSGAGAANKGTVGTGRKGSGRVVGGTKGGEDSVGKTWTWSPLKRGSSVW